MTTQSAQPIRASDVNELLDLAIKQSRKAEDGIAAAVPDVYKMGVSLGWDSTADEEFGDWAFRATHEEIFEEIRRILLDRVEMQRAQSETSEAGHRDADIQVINSYRRTMGMGKLDQASAGYSDQELAEMAANIRKHGRTVANPAKLKARLMR